MENQYQKWVSLSYLAVSCLLGYIIFAFAGKIVAFYDLETRIRYVELVIRGLAVFAGALLFLILYNNQKANEFMGEVILELARVTWPTPKETRSSTVVVIIMVVISGIVLGLLDYFWVHLLKWIL